MAQQADNIGGIQLPALSPMDLAKEAAEAERQEHIELAAQHAQQQQQKRQPRKKKAGEEQSDLGLSLKTKENRVPVALSFDPEMNKYLSYAAGKLGISRSAILEQLFNQWWAEKEDAVRAMQSKNDSMI